MSGDGAWPPGAESLLPLLGLSEAARIADPADLRPARATQESRVLVARTAWLIADPRGGVLVRSADRVIQVAVAREDRRFAPFARVHWADLPRDLDDVAAVVAPLCRSAERLHALACKDGRERGSK
jgi:hypothetical protein